MSAGLHNIGSYIFHNAVNVDLADMKRGTVNMKCCYFIIYLLQDNDQQYSCFKVTTVLIKVVMVTVCVSQQLIWLISP